MFCTRHALLICCFTRPQNPLCSKHHSHTHKLFQRIFKEKNSKLYVYILIKLNLRPSGASFKLSWACCASQKYLILGWFLELFYCLFNFFFWVCCFLSQYFGELRYLILFQGDKKRVFLLELLSLTIILDKIAWYILFFLILKGPTELWSLNENVALRMYSKKGPKIPIKSNFNPFKTSIFWLSQFIPTAVKKAIVSRQSGRWRT